MGAHKTKYRARDAALRADPNSVEYKGDDTRRPYVFTRIDHELVEKPEYLARKAARIEASQDFDEPTDADMNLGLFLTVEMVFPSNLVGPDKWKRGTVAVRRLAVLDYVQIKGDIEKKIAEETEAEPRLVALA